MCPSKLKTLPSHPCKQTPEIAFSFSGHWLCQVLYGLLENRTTDPRPQTPDHVCWGSLGAESGLGSKRKAPVWEEIEEFQEPLKCCN